MDTLVYGIFSPLAALAVIVLAAIVTSVFSTTKRPLGFLFARAGFYALVGAAFSLGLTILWMIWYQYNTGYDLGNAPLGWIIFYGPVSAAIGEIVALIHWLVRKPTSNATPRERI